MLSRKRATEIIVDPNCSLEKIRRPNQNLEGKPKDEGLETRSTALGLRVIRGPDWPLGDVDGGDGHVGTITGVEADGKVEVTWDVGEVATLKIGGEELLVFDNAPAGVRHLDFNCDECGERGIAGIRWNCAECDDYDLCSECYCADKHFLTHKFLRYETTKSEGVEVSPRNRCLQVRVMGVFDDAEVVRGKDWEWDDQDGGEGQKGRVVGLVTPNPSSVRSMVKVEWLNAFMCEYRVGHEGKVDLKFVLEAPGGYCYRKHLPVFDSKSYPTELVKIGAAWSNTIAEGDRVVISVGREAETLLRLEQNDLGSRVTQLIGKVGEVKGFASNGDAIVAFGPDKTFRVVPSVLRKVPNISLGDHVRVLDNEDEVNALQEGHGEYNQTMKPALGKVGEVIKLDSDGDVVVQFERQKWVFNPACLLPAPGQPVDKLEDSEISQALPLSTKKSTKDLNGLWGAVVLADPSKGTGQKAMFTAVMENDIDTVKKILRHDKSLANALDLEKDNGVTALHLAAHFGHFEITCLLVENGANLDAQDRDKATALIHAHDEKIAEYLLESGCDSTLTDDDGQTAAHVAALKGLVPMVEVLKDHGADMNVQDNDGDTPLHNAIQKDHDAVAELLIGWPDTDVSIQNKRSLSPTLLAACRGNRQVLEMLLKRDRRLAEEQNGYGTVPLHLASVHNQTQVMELLLEKYKVKVDQKTNIGMTSLHLAAQEARMDAVQMLIKHGAYVNSKDADGDTPMHILLSSYTDVLEDDRLKQLMMILFGRTLKLKVEARVRIACYLIQAGADPNALNNKGQTPLETCESKTIVEGVKRFLDANPDISIAPDVPSLIREKSQSVANLCRKCCTHQAEILLVPCGHRAVCTACCSKGQKLSSCPQCDQYVATMYDRDGKEVKRGCSVM